MIVSAFAFNFAMVALGLVSVWYLLRTYRLIKSFAFLLLAGSMVYLSLYRLFLPLYPQATAYGLAGPFYAGVAVACFLLYQTLHRVLKGPRYRQEQLNIACKQVRGLGWLDYAVMVTVVAIVLLGLALEIWELTGGL